MVELEYDKVKVSVPENWDDIKLGLYERISEQKPETTRDKVAIAALVCGIDVDLLFSWPAEVFNAIADRLEFLFKENPAEPNPEIEINGVKYVVPIEEELTLGAWVDADEVQKEGKSVLSNVLAIVCRPAGEAYNHKNNEQRAAMFADLPVSKVLGVLAFFLHYKTALDQRTAAYSNLVQAVGQLPLNIPTLRSPGGGIKLSTIWQAAKYYGMILLLRYQLQKFLRTCNIRKTNITPKKRSRS